MSDSASLAGLLAVGGFMFLVLMAVGIVLYFLFAFGLYKLAQNRGIELSWLAFVPIAQMYIVGLLIKELKIFSFAVPNPELVLPGAALVNLLLSKVDIIGPLTTLAVVVLDIAAFYWLLKRYKGDSATVMTVVSVILPFMGPIFVFMMRDAKSLDS